MMAQARRDVRAVCVSRLGDRLVQHDSISHELRTLLSRDAWRSLGSHVVFQWHCPLRSPTSNCSGLFPTHRPSLHKFESRLKD